MKTLRFQEGSQVQFEKQDDGGLPKFSMLGYSGKAMPTPFGKIVIDLAGMKPRSKTTPVFQHHDRERIVGHSENLTIDTKVALQGIVSGVGEAAVEVQQTSANGFPWQSSVGVDVLKLEDMKAGDTEEINGYKVSGPALVLRKTDLSEISFVPLGMDKHTSAAVNFSEELSHELEQLLATANEPNPQEAVMPENTNEQEFSKQLEDAKHAGEQQAAERLKGLLEEFPQEFAFDVYDRGLSVVEAKAEYYDKFSKPRFVELEAKIAELQAQAPVAAEGTDPVEYVEAPNVANAQVEFDAKLAEFRREGLDEGDAYRKVCDLYPALADKAFGLNE